MLRYGGLHRSQVWSGLGCVLSVNIKYGPEGGGNPTDEGKLKNEADDSSQDIAPVEEGLPGYKNCDQVSHKLGVCLQ